MVQSVPEEVLAVVTAAASAARTAAEAALREAFLSELSDDEIEGLTASALIEAYVRLWGPALGGDPAGMQASATNLLFGLRVFAAGDSQPEEMH